MCHFSGCQVVLAQRNPGIAALDKLWAIAVGGRAGRAAGASSPPPWWTLAKCPQLPQRAIALIEPGLSPIICATSALLPPVHSRHGAVSWPPQAPAAGTRRQPPGSAAQS